jgi:surfactin synthase thioesterase subunit/glycosyltransferase involved in cell wall biosynthesis
MRILLAQNSLYYPAHGGGDKSNRLLVEALAALGHECRAVARIGSLGPQPHEAYLGELAAHAIAVISAADGVVTFRHNGVDVHVLTDHPNLRAYLAEQIARFEPDVILSSTDDPAQMLFEVALKTGTARVVYLARATLALPFGPDCAFPSAAKTEMLRRADAVVGVSQYVADYIRRWGSIDAVHVPISLMDAGPYPALGSLSNDFVTLVNPCAVKGISIFLALAGRMPRVWFAAVPTWGTNAADRAALEARPNIRILDPVDHIDDLLARTRVLLAPSLWAEARSRMILEAMLRGVPVLAANVGGIPEAMMGCDYLLPVRPIEKYRPALDERMVPVADVPEQDLGPWCDALTALLTSSERYEQLACVSRQAALRFVENLSAAPFEELLKRVTASPKRALSVPVPAAEKLTEKLSPEKRRLLALRLRRMHTAPSNAWFPGADAVAPGAIRLFSFPHAGGGVSVFHGWSEELNPGDTPARVRQPNVVRSEPGVSPVILCPVRLPGRENRASEPMPASMRELVTALGEAIEPYLDAPFAFYGQSMGAAVAFELSRALCASDRPLPACLIVSAARAPQYRLGHVPGPEPTEAEFIGELRGLEGVPPSVLDNPELLRLLLPVLRADAALYRNYVYSEQPPLACPIRAYGGAEDPNVTREHLEGWARQTTSSFAVHVFPGGHFFANTSRDAFFETLAADLGELAGKR